MKISTMQKIYGYTVAGVTFLQGICASIVVDSVLKKADVPKPIKAIGRNAVAATISTIFTGLSVYALHQALSVDDDDPDFPIESSEDDNLEDIPDSEF